jgi:methylated-DNA-[protein]-cysteine S-methyltransferase
MQIDDAPQIEELLRSAAPAVDGWQRVRERFAARATADGLLDVAFEDHETPLGRVRLGATATGIVRVALPSEDAGAMLDELARKVSARVLRSVTPVLAEARRELDEYFDGDRRTFDVALDWTLSTAFRREVLRATAQIPYGATSSYRGVATLAGSPNAVRAAGTALATNPLPILVPCHRVLRTDGSLGRYRGGEAAKAQLLRLEQAI